MLGVSMQVRTLTKQFALTRCITQRVAEARNALIIESDTRTLHLFSQTPLCPRNTPWPKGESLRARRPLAIGCESGPLTLGYNKCTQVLLTNSYQSSSVGTKLLPCHPNPLSTMNFSRQRAASIIHYPRRTPTQSCLLHEELSRCRRLPRVV